MDDRFYVAILLAHQLYEMRRGTIITVNADEWDDVPISHNRTHTTMVGGCVSPLAL